MDYINGQGTGMSIIEINTLAKISEYLDRGTLLLLDIDDTLIKAVSTFVVCPNLEFRYKLKEYDFRWYKGKFYSYNDPRYLTLLKHFNEQIEKYRWVLTEPLNRYWLKEWKNKSAEVYAFTARGMEVRKFTNHTLKGLGLNFDNQDRINRIIHYDTPSNRAGRNYCHNIIYCGGESKAKIFKHINFLKITKVWGKQKTYEYWSIWPKVVFVDDSLENLEAVELICKQYGIEFKGLHYVR